MTTAATLSGDFEITTSGGVAELQKLGGAMDQTTDRIVGQAARVETTVAGMVNSQPAVRAMGALVTAGDEMSASMVRARNRIETSAERMIAQLEREAVTYGKTREQVRAMDVETKLLAANENNLTDVAERLRRAHQNLVAVQSRVTGQTGAQRAGFQQLSFQIGDVATQMGSGTAVMQIFAQQAGQTVQAIGLMTTEAKGFIGFLGGPWGQIITAAVVLVGTLAASHKSAADAAKTETKSYATLTDATKALDDATGRLHKTKEQEIADAYNAAQAKLKDAIATRTRLAATLAEEQARDRSALSSGGKLGGDIAGLTGTQIEVTKGQIAANEAALKGAQIALDFAKRQQDFAGIQASVAAATDKVVAAQQRFDAVQRVLQAGVEAGTISVEDANRQLLIATERLNAVKNADHEAAAAAREHRHEMVEQAKAEREVAKAAQLRADIAQHAKELEGRNAAAGTKILDVAPIKTRVDKHAFDLMADQLNLVKDLNIELENQAARWDDIANSAANATNGMAAGFGRVGESVGAMVSIFSDLKAQQAGLAAAHEKQLQTLTDQRSIDHENALFAQKNLSLQIAGYGHMIDAAQGYFKKGSVGYKALGAVSAAYHAAELAAAVVNAATQIGLFAGIAAAHTAKTASIVADNGVESSTGAVTAVVNAIKEIPWPLNLVAGAATIAALASIGVGIAGGFGHGAKPPPTNSGTGTVFGDPTAQSQSLSKSIDALKEVDTLTMRTSAEMLTVLKSIDQAVGGLTNSVINSGNIGAGLGITESSGGLFGTKKKIVASGIYGGPESLTDILAGSFDVDYFADVSKKKFLGSTKIKTTFADAGDEMGAQFALILQGFVHDVEAAADPLGASLDDVHARLANFVVDIGRIDTKGLSGEDIQKKLEAVFSAEGDRIAAAALPGLAKYEQAGEGYLETLTRVATSVETVTTSLEMLGRTTAGVGVDASMTIAGMFDSLSDLNDATSAYFDAYYSDAEKSAAKTAQLGKAFDMLGVAMPATLADFRALVEAQDLTTTSGEQTYATLLKLAPAFAALRDTGKSAADILSERADIERNILEIQGDTDAIRALDLAKLDESNRALQLHAWALQDEKDAADAAAQAAQVRAGLQQQIWQLEGNTEAIRAAQLDAMTDPIAKAMQQQIFALTDQQEAAKKAQQEADKAAQAADQLRQAWKSVADSILDEVNDIRGAMVTGPQSYASLLGQFNVATERARGGDQDAAKALPGLAKSMLDAAAEAATSQQELLRVQGVTAASLEQTYNLINKLSGNATTPVATGFGTANTGNAEAQASWFAAFQANAQGLSAAANDDDIVDALKGLKADNAELRALLASLFAQLASPLNRVDKNIDKVVSAGGGNAFAVAADPDEPVPVAVIGTVKTQAA